MQRALTRLSSEHFDCLIVGGGATGCFTARDAARRGLSVALVEANDFASATSAHSSRLAHGGLRYLRNLEIGLVRESLRERGTLLKIAPHLVRPLPFLLPVAGLGERLKLAAGLTLYDLLAGRQLPSHRWLKRDAALEREPVLADGKSPARLRGAFEYHDAQMYSPERIALENLIDADVHGAAIANHLACEGLLMRSGKVEGASVRDTLSGETFDIRARTVVVAAGPWADLFLEKVTGRASAHKLVRSKGIHLLVPLVSRSALAIEAGNGHLFALPWRGHTLLATTDTPFTGDPATVAVEESDIDALLGQFNKYLPAAALTRGHVQAFYAGLRPLVADGKDAGTYNLSRRAQLVDHAGEGLGGVFSALGGKWTTSRALAQTVTDALAARLGKKTQRCTTAAVPLPGGRFDDFDLMLRGFNKTWPGISALRPMAHMLGARLPEALKGARLADLIPFNESGDTPAQVAFSLRHEMALTLEDMVMRRTSVGQFGPPAQAVLENIAARMAAHLGWDAARQAHEIAALAPIYRIAA
jgi:glycerol-3-phosphate dehydrogenase